MTAHSRVITGEVVSRVTTRWKEGWSIGLDAYVVWGSCVKSYRFLMRALIERRQRDPACQGSEARPEAFKKHVGGYDSLDGELTTSQQLLSKCVEVTSGGNFHLYIAELKVWRGHGHFCSQLRFPSVVIRNSGSCIAKRAVDVMSSAATPMDESGDRQPQLLQLSLQADSEDAE